MSKKRRRPVRLQQYWHGLGAWPDPYSVQRIDTAQMRGLPVRPGAPPGSAQYVHASTSWEVALAFSALSGGNAVCEIDPGSLVAEPDPDYPTIGVRFRGPVKVLSVEVVEPAELPSARQITKALAADGLWTDHTPRYSEDGYLRAPTLSRARGYVDEDFRWLGQWWPWQFVVPMGDGTEMVLDERCQGYLMYPPGFRGLNGRPRVPTGSLDGAWTRPGFYPNHVDWLHRHRQRVQSAGPADLVVLRPWQW